MCSYEEALEFLLINYPELTIQIDYALDHKSTPVSIHDAKLMVKEAKDLMLDDGLDVMECFIVHRLHDKIMSGLYSIYNVEDAKVFEICKAFNRRDLSLELPRACKHLDIPVPASIVELASLDGRRTPQEKMQCLCSCYDLIYAELKMALIETFEDDAHWIPCLNNVDVVPVIIKVIIAAKPKHLYSNLVFIQGFLLGHQSTTAEFILQQFELAYNHLKCYTLGKQGAAMVTNELDQRQFHEMVTNTAEMNSNTVNGFKMRRIAELINQSHKQGDQVI